MEKKWRVSDVELLEGGLLFGFALYDQKGLPCVSFGYQTEAKANAGRDHVVAALNRSGGSSLWLVGESNFGGASKSRACSAAEGEICGKQSGTCPQHKIVSGAPKFF